MLAQVVKTSYAHRALFNDSHYRVATLTAEGVHRQKASQVATISGGQADMLPWSSNRTVCQRREAENLFSLWSNNVMNSARGLSAYTYPIRRS